LSTEQILEENFIFIIFRWITLFPSILFFFYLLFTFLKYRYRREENLRIDTGRDEIAFTSEEIENFRKWTFDKGINLVFSFFFILPLVWIPILMDKVKPLFSVILAYIVLLLLSSAFISFFKMKLVRASIFGILSFPFVFFCFFINEESKKIIEAEKKLGENSVVESIKEVHDITLWYDIALFLVKKEK
jgi:hypothetical protein